LRLVQRVVRVFSCFSCLAYIFGSGFSNSASKEVIQNIVADKETTNSTEFAGQETREARQPETTTMHTTRNESPKKITMSFIGDCLIASYMGEKTEGSLNWTAERKPPEYFFEKVAKIFLEDDITVANLENVFTDSELKPVEKSGRAFWFKSPAKNARILAKGGVDAVTVENNHSYDYGRQGFLDTLEAVEKAGIKAGYNGNPVIIEKNGIRVGIVCCGLWVYSHYTRAVRQVEEIEPVTDIQIVYFHGGEEKIHQPEEWKKKAARKIAEAGADLVIGSHPHVLQPMEIYHGVPIVYSLGNFVYGGNRKPENRTIVFQAFFEIEGGQVKVSYDIIPCYVYTGSTNNWQPDIITDTAEKEKVFEFMMGRSGRPY